MKKRYSNILFTLITILLCTSCMLCIYQANDSEHVYQNIENLNQSAGKEESYIEFLKTELTEQLLTLDGITTCTIHFETEHNTILAVHLSVLCESPQNAEPEVEIKEYISKSLAIPSSNITIEYL